VISLCKQNRLICVLEVHDTTGYGEQSGAASLAQAVDYWLRVRSALVGQEQYVIVNIGNEPFGNTGYAAWTQDTISAIQRLREAGFEHTLMVDAPNWGQDWTFTMRDNAASVFDADPQRNTMFSVHMYGVFDTAAEITDYIGRFVSAGLPILVGEFGHNHSDGNPDEDAIMATAEAQRIGYLGWSWSGNGGGVEYLDMVTAFDPTQLTSWGERIFNGPDGIRQTSREATVFGGGSPDTTPPSAPGTPQASDITSSSVTLAWAAATDDTGVSGYEVVRVSGSTETAAVTSTSTSATVTGLSPATSYTFAVYARDAAGNRSPRSATVTTTTQAAGAGACTASYRLVGEWSGGFQAEVTVVNAGTTEIDGWRLEWTFPAGQTITNMWHAVPTQDGAAVVAANVDHNRLISPGGSVTIGFTGSWTSANPAPDTVALNGARCAAA
jgi:mannan endo-1,4-beta-mannosidase